MKVLRPHWTLLRAIGLFYFFTALISTIYFPGFSLKILQFTSPIGLLLIVALLISYKKNNINEEVNNKPPINLLYYCKVISIQLFFIIIFFITMSCLLSADTPPIDTQYLSQNFMQHLFLNWGVFPWAYAIIISIIFNHYLFKLKKAPAISSALDTLYSGNEHQIAKGLMDGILNNGIFFITCNIIALISLKFCGIILQAFNIPFQFGLHLSSFFTTLLLVLLSFSKSFTHLLRILYNRLVSFGGLTIFIIMLITITVTLTTLISHYFPDTTPLEHSKHITSKINQLLQWNLFIWSWWMLAAPLMGILTTLLCESKNSWQLIFSQLILPICLFFVWFLKPYIYYILMISLQKPIIEWISMMLITLTFIIFLFPIQNEKYLAWDTEQKQKKRPLRFNKLRMFLIGSIYLFMIYWLNGTRSIASILFVLGFAIWIVIMIAAIGLFKNIYNSHYSNETRINNRN